MLLSVPIARTDGPPTGGPTVLPAARSGKDGSTFDALVDAQAGLVFVREPTVGAADPKTGVGVRGSFDADIEMEPLGARILDAHTEDDEPNPMLGATVLAFVLTLPVPVDVPPPSSTQVSQNGALLPDADSAGGGSVALVPPGASDRSEPGPKLVSFGEPRRPTVDSPLARINHEPASAAAHALGASAGAPADWTDGVDEPVVTGVDVSASLPAWLGPAAAAATAPPLAPAAATSPVDISAPALDQTRPVESPTETSASSIVRRRPATVLQFPVRDESPSQVRPELPPPPAPRAEDAPRSSAAARMLRVALSRTVSRGLPQDQASTEVSPQGAVTEPVAGGPVAQAQPKGAAAPPDGRSATEWVAPRANLADEKPVRSLAAPLVPTGAYEIRPLPERGGSFDSEARQNDRRAPTPSAPPAIRGVHVTQEASSVNVAPVGLPAIDHAAALSGSIANEAGNAASIVRSIRLQSQHGVGKAVVDLDPEYLGSVTIALRVEGGAVTATVHAESAQVRAWLEANEPALRQGLADQGLALDRLFVSEERQTDANGSRNGSRRDDRQDPQEPPRRPSKANAGLTFDVVV